MTKEEMNAYAELVEYCAYVDQIITRNERHGDRLITVRSDMWRVLVKEAFQPNVVRVPARTKEIAG